jgi:hypothetical protein
LKLRRFEWSKYALKHYSINAGSSYLSSLFLRLNVGVDKELGEKEEERKDVDDVGGSNPQGNVGATCYQKITSLRHHGDKLKQLHHGKRRLPPDGKRLASLVVLGVHANEIVGVHDGVDESVENNREIDVTIVVGLSIEPVEKENSDVMIDVQKGKLSPLLSNDNENGIPKVPSFGDVE